MSGEKVIPRLVRSQDSIRFLDVLRQASLPGLIPRQTDIDYSGIRDLVPRMLVVDPDAVTRTLKFVRAGSDVVTLIGRKLVGTDSLDLIDPAIKGDVFDSSFLMLSKPCGLWQISPALTSEGKRVMLEYTGHPIFDHVRGRGRVMCFIQHAAGPLQRIVKVGRAQVWNWIDLRSASGQ